MGLSIWHLILVLIIILLFFGPSRLPDVGKSLGKAIRDFKKGLNGEEDHPSQITHETKEKLPPPTNEDKKE